MKEKTHQNSIIIVAIAKIQWLSEIVDEDLRNRIHA